MLVQHMRDRNYLAANDVYLKLAIGNAPWPIGTHTRRRHQAPTDLCLLVCRAQLSLQSAAIACARRLCSGLVGQLSRRCHACFRVHYVRPSSTSAPACGSASAAAWRMGAVAVCLRQVLCVLTMMPFVSCLCLSAAGAVSAAVAVFASPQV